MIRAYGPIIVQNEHLLVTLDKKDPFYKIPGGRPLKGEEGETTCVREALEETGLRLIILGKANTMVLNSNPKTGKPQHIELYHYFARPRSQIKDFSSYDYNGHKIRWIPIGELRKGVYPIAPNIRFLIEKGDIK